MHDDATLWKHVDGEIAPERSRALEAEAAGDPALRARLEEMRAMKAAVLQGAPHPPQDFPDRLARLARSRPAAPLLDIEEARRFLRRALIAAAILAALGIAYLAVEIAPTIIEPIKASPLLLP